MEGGIRIHTSYYLDYACEHCGVWRCRVVDVGVKVEFKIQFRAKNYPARAEEDPTDALRDPLQGVRA
jgi:hypothetical protein